MATKETASRFEPASNNPDDFSTGRADKFIGTISSALAYPYKGKNSKDNKFFLNIGLGFIPDEDSGFDPFTEAYSGGFLNQAVPSKDNRVPAGASDDEYIALSNGKTEGLDKPCLDDHFNVIPSCPYVGGYILGKMSKGRSWEQFLIALRDSDTKNVIDWGKPGDLSFLVGLKCRFDRVPQTGSGAKKEGAQEFKVLVPTEIISVGNATGKGAASSASAQSANGSGSLAERIVTEILNQLRSAPGNKLEVGKLVNDVPKALLIAGSISKGEKGEVMGWIGERAPKPNEKMPVNLIDIDGTTFDPAAQTLELDK